MENSSPTRDPQRTSYVFAPTSTSDPHAQKASDPTSPAFFSGSSFKPLHLTHLPWVSAYLRPDQKEGSYREFRLPYVVQYAHLQGENSIHYHKSPSLPSPRQIPVLDKRTANPPSTMNTNANDTGLTESDSIPGGSTSSSPTNEQARIEQSEIEYFSLPIASSQCTMDGITESSESNNIFESSQDPDNREQSFFDIEGPAGSGTENRTPSELSQSSTPVSPLPNATRRPSTDGRRLGSYKKRKNSALPITAFQSELIGEITVAEDAFGYSPTSQDYQL